MGNQTEVWNENSVKRGQPGNAAQFAAQAFSDPDIKSFDAAPSPEVREQTSRAVLEAAVPALDLLVTGFDENFRGDEDGRRVADLARSEGVVGAIDQRYQVTPFKVTLARTDDLGEVQTISLDFHTENGAAPTSAQVLNTLLTDSAGLNEIDSVDDWANQYGYDLAEEEDIVRDAYERTVQQDADVQAFLGDRYDAYLWGDQ